MIGHSPYAPANLYHPEPPGVCDRCGFKYLLKNLSWQSEWRGLSLQNLNIRVCPECLDKPQDQLRPIIIGPDPVPVKNPREPFYATQMGLPVPTLSTVQLRGATNGRPPYASDFPVISGAGFDVGEINGARAGMMFDSNGEELLDTRGHQLFSTQGRQQQGPLLPNNADRPGYPDQLYDTRHKPLTDTTIKPWVPVYSNLTPLQARLYGTVNHAPGQTEVLPSPPFKNDPRYIVLDD